jgi:hypothetical protein
MNLRDHPMMIRKSGYPSWPPVWTTTHADRDNKPVGEVGALEEIMMSNMIDNKVFMFIESDGFRYMGFMTFDDLTFCSQIGVLLKANRGRSIKDIGDLDVSHIF